MVVTAVCRSPVHAVSKPSCESIRLLAGLGVEGDAYLGETVQHRSRVAQDPSRPNLRQVHLIHAELHDELRAAGFAVSAGQLGENVTTRGVDLLGLPAGARLRLGGAAVVEVAGLRNPCVQLDGIQPGLMAATLGRDDCTSSTAMGSVMRGCARRWSTRLAWRRFCGIALEGRVPDPKQADEADQAARAGAARGAERGAAVARG